MKPNLLIFHPSDDHLNPIIEALCESYVHTHWVFLVKPGFRSDDDSSRGRKFLTDSLDDLPPLPVETVIVVGNEQIASEITDHYSDSEVLFWNTEEESVEALKPATSSSKVVECDFGYVEKQELSRAM